MGSKTGVTLPSEAGERKKIPLWSGLFKYFPDALVEVAKLSWKGNEQHNPGESLHWAREKSADQEDTLLRHMIESGTADKDGVLHSVKVAWRALAMAQLELEEARNKSNSELNCTNYSAVGTERPASPPPHVGIGPDLAKSLLVRKTLQGTTDGLGRDLRPLGIDGSEPRPSFRDNADGNKPPDEINYNR